MRPVRTGQSNFTYLGPTPVVADLPCRRVDGGRVYSVWQPTDEERQMIANGAQIELAVTGEPHPPVSLAVVDQPEKPDADDLRCEGCNGLYTRGRGLTACGWCGGRLVPASA